MSQFVVEERAVNSFFGGPIASKKSSKKKATVENLSQIQAKLFNAGISKSTIIKAPAVTLSDGVKISYTGNFDNDVSRNCNWCKCQIVTEKLGVPLWMENKKYYSEGCFCSFNCLLAYQQEQTSVKYRECGLLTHYLYRELFQQPMKLTSSKSWKLLQDYGGELSLKQWRGLCDSFAILTPDDYDKYKQLIVPSSELFIGD